MTCNNYWEGVLLADLQGEGHLSVVSATRGSGDCARIQALGPNGEVVWSQDFDEFPGAPPGWNVPGLMYWQGGYFRERRRMELLIQMRRVEGETYLLEGRNGAVGSCAGKGTYAGSLLSSAYQVVVPFKRFRITVWQVCILEYITEQLWNTRIGIHFGNSLTVEVQ